MTLQVYAIVEGVEFTRRELEAMLFIHDYVQRDILHRPPSHRELLEHLNSVLPEDERLVSTQQTQRIIEKLRDKGVVLHPSQLPKGVSAGHQRLMRLTPAGNSLVLQYRAQQGDEE